MRDNFQPFSNGKYVQPQWQYQVNGEPNLLYAQQRPIQVEPAYIFNPEYDPDSIRRDEQMTAMEGCLYGLFAACCCCLLFDLL